MIYRAVSDAHPYTRARTHSYIHYLKYSVIRFKMGFFHTPCTKLPLCARSNKKACAKCSFAHVVKANCIRYAGEKVILSSCGLFSLASLGRKRSHKDKITFSL